MQLIPYDFFPLQIPSSNIGLASLAAQRTHLQYRRPWFDPWVRKFPWRRDRLPPSVFLGFSDRSDGKESACNEGDTSSIPGSGSSPGEGIGFPFQYSWAFPGGLDRKESTCNAGDLSSIPGLGSSPGEGIGYPLQYSWASLLVQLVKNPSAMRESYI